MSKVCYSTIDWLNRTTAWRVRLGVNLRDLLTSNRNLSHRSRGFVNVAGVVWKWWHAWWARTTRLLPVRHQEYNSRVKTTLNLSPTTTGARRISTLKLSTSAVACWFVWTRDNINPKLDSNPPRGRTLWTSRSIHEPLVILFRKLARMTSLATSPRRCVPKCDAEAPKLQTCHPRFVRQSINETPLPMLRATLRAKQSRREWALNLLLPLARLKARNDSASCLEPPWRRRVEWSIATYTRQVMDTTTPGDADGQRGPIIDELIVEQVVNSSEFEQQFGELLRATCWWKRDRNLQPTRLRLPANGRS